MQAVRSSGAGLVGELLPPFCKKASHQVGVGAKWQDICATANFVIQYTKKATGGLLKGEEDHEISLLSKEKSTLWHRRSVSRLNATSSRKPRRMTNDVANRRNAKKMSSAKMPNRSEIY